MTFSDSRSLIYSQPSTNSIRKTDVTVNPQKLMTEASPFASPHISSKFEYNRQPFLLDIIDTETEDPMIAVRKDRKVTFLQIDPRNSRNLFIGYENGMAEIIDSSNFMKSIYSTDKNDTVKYNGETKKRSDLGEVAKIVFHDDPSLFKRHDYANLIVVHGKHVANQKCLT